MPEAQLLETRVLNLVHFETVIASKAARAVLAAEGKRLVDFGLRRAHGAEAGLLAARASYLAGFEGTSTVYAGREWGIPVFGTMAHSFVQAHESEAQAFERFIEVFPQSAVLLIDTYDTVAAARKVAELSRALAARGVRPKGVRLDSGNLAQLAREVRAVLDEAGLRDAFIFASGNLDEHRIAALLAQGAPIDAFGVGSSLVTASDAPVLDAVYKLQEYDGKPRRKRSAGKATWPGRKQVYRRYAGDGRMRGDRVTLESDPAEGEALLAPVMREGRRLAPATSLEESRRHAQSQLERLPVWLRTLSDSMEPYPVEIAPSIVALAEQLDRG
jgi:nicotinate phosphoribosyltransferase